LFGHQKLEKVYPLLVAQMINKYSVLLRQLSENRAEEVRFNRFVNNKKVKPEALVSFHWQQHQQGFSKKHLLMIGDTTTLTFKSRADREYLGYIGEKTNKEGFDIHSAMVVDAQDGGVYGLGGIKIIRNLAPQGKPAVRSKSYSKANFELTERYKWFEVAQSAVNNCKGATTYTLVGDRETDIYDLIVRTLDANWQFVYRSHYNRKLDKQTKLVEAIDSWPVKHQYDFEVQATKKRSQHQAKVDVKFGSITLPKPKGHPNKSLRKEVQLNVIEIKEQPDSVKNQEEPIHWRLLSSHPVDTIEQVMQIIQWYCWRWNIEQAFRTFKRKGLDIENAELESFHGLANLATLSLIAAMQVMQLVQARDGKTSQRTEDVFTPEEQQCLSLLNIKLQGKTKKQKNPHPPNSLAFASWITIMSMNLVFCVHTVGLMGCQVKAAK